MLGWHAPLRRRAPLWCALALLLLSLPACAGEAPAMQNTVEWGRLVSFWHLMLDHSSGAVYSPERFHEAAPKLDTAESDITSLVVKKLLPQDTGEALRGVFRDRYQYLEERCYPSTGHVSQSSTEAVTSASHWVVEMQLTLLRRQSRAGKSDRKLRDAIQANLTTELAFQQAAAKLKRQETQEREALSKKEAEKERVDWSQFDARCAQRGQSLLVAYGKRQPPRDRIVPRLVGLLVDLTEAQPPDTSADHLSPGL
jgi:hypothetical protein